MIENKKARYIRIFLEYITLLVSIFVLILSCYFLYKDIIVINYVGIFFDSLFCFVFFSECIFKIKQLPYK